jgi:hypothetical protein
MLRQFILWITGFLILILFLLLLISTAKGIFSPWPLGSQFFSLAPSLAGVSAFAWLATHIRHH